MCSAVIKSFKHDGSSHRLWMYVEYIKEDDDFYYLGAKRAKVIEHDGREWRAPEGALYILSKKRFYNAIVMFVAPNVVEYYINIASPSIINGKAFMFIDYDLDLKKSRDGKVKEIDWGEYYTNGKIYGYTSKMKKVLEATLKEVKQQLEKAQAPFNDEENLALFNANIMKENA